MCLHKKFSAGRERSSSRDRKPELWDLDGLQHPHGTLRGPEQSRKCRQVPKTREQCPVGSHAAQARARSAPAPGLWAQGLTLVWLGTFLLHGHCPR